MATTPISLRLDADLHRLLSEGARKTPLQKQDLIRRTLRKYLPRVIDQESTRPLLTSVARLDPGTMTKTYKRLARMEPDWDRIEDAAVKAQSHPSWDD